MMIQMSFLSGAYAVLAVQTILVMKVGLQCLVDFLSILITWLEKQISSLIEMG